MSTFKETLEIIENSAVFKKFKQENSNAELVAGFFILDFLSNDNKDSLDYQDETTEQIYTFELDKNNEVVMKKDKLIEQETTQKKLTKLTKKPKIETNELKGIVGERKLEQGISANFNKIIAVLQNYEGSLVWNLTCMLDQLIILHVLVDAETSEITKFERKSMMDFIRKK